MLCLRAHSTAGTRLSSLEFISLVFNGLSQKHGLWRAACPSGRHACFDPSDSCLHISNGDRRACRSSRPAGGAKAAPAPPPPPTVSVIALKPETVPVSNEWVATLDGFVNAQIRPQVIGLSRESRLSRGRDGPQRRRALRDRPASVRGGAGAGRGAARPGAGRNSGAPNATCERDTPLAKAARDSPRASWITTSRRSSPRRPPSMPPRPPSDCRTAQSGLHQGALAGRRRSRRSRRRRSAISSARQTC